MKQLSGIIFVLLAVASMAAVAQTNNSDAQTAFNRLKQLQGEWQGTLADGKPSKVSYRVIAAGSAVEEVYPDQHGDMLTVYTLDGDHILLTHFCMAHNQPRMTAKALKDDDLAFEFLDLSGASPAAAGHMHNASFHFTDPDHFTATWHFVENGKEKFAENIQYARLR